MVGIPPTPRVGLAGNRPAPGRKGSEHATACLQVHRVACMSQLIHLIPSALVLTRMLHAQGTRAVFNNGVPAPFRFPSRTLTVAGAQQKTVLRMNLPLPAREERLQFQVDQPAAPSPHGSSDGTATLITGRATPPETSTLKRERK